MAELYEVLSQTDQRCLNGGCRAQLDSPAQSQGFWCWGRFWGGWMRCCESAERSLPGQHRQGGAGSLEE